MKKDIYIIKNSINDKVYIGQSENAAKRWLSHIYNAKYEEKTNKAMQVIHKAMSKYGIENFHYEILEYQISNYDEREKYWIARYNSVVPNGYNVALGGTGTGAGLESPLAIFKDRETLMKCISEISATKKSFTNIAKKYGCCEEVISAINNGFRYKQNGLVYPLRDTNTRYPEEMVKQIRYSLKYETDLTLADIAIKYHTDLSQISNINTGKIYFLVSESYPLRKKRLRDLDHETVYSIIKDIIESPLCLSDIAARHNVSREKVTQINHGNAYRQPNLLYPLRNDKDIRTKSLKKFLDDGAIREIQEKLSGSASIAQIASEYGVSSATIYNINNGTCKKYRRENIIYPIRSFN